MFHHVKQHSADMIVVFGKIVVSFSVELSQTSAFSAIALVRFTPIYSNLWLPDQPHLLKVPVKRESERPPGGARPTRPLKPGRHWYR